MNVFTKRYQVLDHGYVEFKDHWGDGGKNIIRAARQSTQGSFRGWDDDLKLLRYLQKNKHATPFEFSGLTIEVQAPLFVFREWHRHRTQSYNEMSARYTPLPALYYMPSIDRLMIGSDGTNKQAGAMKGASHLTESAAIQFQGELKACYRKFESEYNLALNVGVPKELARCGMPVGHYSRMYAQANLRNWLGFLTLRMSPHAQWEIRQYANAVAGLIESIFPEVWQVYRESMESGN